MQTSTFQKLITEYYIQHGRDLPWRFHELQPTSETILDPYKITLSEIMLQQTQVSRVIPKYQTFIQTFPTIKSLAAASFEQVLTAWLGLGYNRRAKYLHHLSCEIVGTHNGTFPATKEELQALPGIGINTAAAIMVYAYNQPEVFIETNIRSVYMHHFFPKQHEVTDRELMPYIVKTLDRANPREWYWALMDYGTFLKSTNQVKNSQSKHYKKQSVFKDSNRQLRGAVLRALAVKPLSWRELYEQIPDERLENIVGALQHEQLIQGSKQKLYL